MNAELPELPASGPAVPEASVFKLFRQAKPPGREPHGEGWSRNRWLALIAMVFAAHIGLVFAFGEHRFDAPRFVTNVPTLQLADNSKEWLALNDPTLFALPHERDFASAVWLHVPHVKPPSFRWTEPPRWLRLSGGKLGMVFNQFMQTNRFADFQPELRPPPELSVPMLEVEPAFAKTSWWQIEGDLARRRLLTPMALTNWQYTDVIVPSKVQVLVDAAGNVVSAVLLPSDNDLEVAGHYDAADRHALELARAARFTPSSELTFGRLIFNWHTVPMPATNAPPAVMEHE